MNTNNNSYCLRINKSISSNILSIELYKWVKKINPKKNIQLLDIDKFISSKPLLCFAFAAAERKTLIIGSHEA